MISEPDLNGSSSDHAWPVISEQDVLVAVSSVVRRRIFTAEFYLRKISRKLSSAPDFSFQFSRNALALAIHPRGDKARHQQLQKKFGSILPLAYSVNGVPIGPFPYVGALEIAKFQPTVITGAGKFETVLRTNCLLDLKNDSGIALKNLKLNSISIHPEIELDVYIAFIICFGEKLNPYFMEDTLDDFVSSIITRDQSSVSQ